MARLIDELAHIANADPAAPTKREVALTYPGFHAVRLHRLANFIWRCRWKTGARIVAAFSRFMTGIEIHPAAKIGAFLFIDHGMGVVIGETAVIGDRVTLFHGVTLGGVGHRGEKRHPTVGDDVIVGAGAKLLGAITIGAGARVGANAVVVKDVAPGVTVVGIPARAVDATSEDALAVGSPAAEAAESVEQRLAAMEERLAQMEGGKAAALTATDWVPPRRKSSNFDA